MINSYKNNSVLAFGNFDGVHLGHQQIIDQVKKSAKENNCKSAILTFNPHPKNFFNPNTNGFYLTEPEQKASIIKQTGINLLYVITFSKDFARVTPESFIKEFLIEKFNARKIIVGSKCFFGKNKSGNLSLLESLSNKYKYKVKKLKNIKIDGKSCSSSEIRKLIQSGELKKANKMLGRNFTIRGLVIKGLQRGKTIGFPTINIPLDDYVIPQLGVYYAKISINENYHFGIVNIGKRPTFSTNEQILLEMHIFNFDSNIYDKKVSIELTDFIRPEQKFNNAEELKRQIKLDINIAKQKLK
ncbi:MAG: bifunctional riboflavin kinase/FAD synthetase [Rickettsiaceae bacterium H1]|nr:bifunctional riboflavin kinase/FAD synthetase [Rickettsiaceae bacterium H1]